MEAWVSEMVCPSLQTHVLPELLLNWGKTTHNMAREQKKGKGRARPYDLLRGHSPKDMEIFHKTRLFYVSPAPNNTFPAT